MGPDMIDQADVINQKLNAFFSRLLMFFMSLSLFAAQLLGILEFTDISNRSCAPKMDEKIKIKCPPFKLS